jgi:hypothetical protein
MKAYVGALVGLIILVGGVSAAIVLGIVMAISLPWWIWLLLLLIFMD